MNPYLRPLDTNAPLPDGWTTEQVGQWQEHEVELVYDPRRHDVMLVRGPAADDADRRLAQIGYEFVATDGQIGALVPRPTRRRPQHAGASTRRRCKRGQGARALTMHERFSVLRLQRSLELDSDAAVPKAS